MAFARGVFVLWVTVFAAAGCARERFDLLVRGGTVVDGTGDPRSRADVGIRDGRIAWLGVSDTVRAADTVDAEGLIVAPGFVDVHSHTPPALADTTRRGNEGVVRQGVTTVVGGPDGWAGPAELETLIAAVEEWGAGTNVAFYVGHNGIRSAVLDDPRQPPDSAELEEMKALVRKGMELGAVGLSTGLMYEPGMFSATDEVVALAGEVAAYGGIYDSHVRDPVHALVASDREAVEIGRRAGIPAKIGHLKAVGLHNDGKISEVIALVEAARSGGHEVVSDQYPYDGAATSRLRRIIVLPPDLRPADGEPPDLDRMLRDPDLRTRIKETSEQGVDGGFAWLKATGYTSMRITSSDDYPDLVGRYLSELADERRIDPFDLVSELILDADEPVGITLGAIAERDVRTLMVQPWNMIASDGAYSDGVSPTGHPRSTGTFPRVLGRYVREWNVLTLEEAVRKMTSLPADAVGLPDRGRIAVGAAADLAIFDAATVIDRSTWDEPHRFAVGIHHVIVNGVPVLRSGDMTGAYPGRILRRGT